MKRKTKGKSGAAMLIPAVAVIALLMVFAMPRITPNKAAGPDEGTMENVNPSEYIAEPVDLGLSVKWASFNVGASKPEEYGGLYGWGDATGTKTSTDNADYPNETPPENISGTEYDIAHVKWGGTWRLPTKEEQDELVEKCEWEKGSYHGVKGYTVTGTNGNTIFMPAEKGAKTLPMK